MEDRRNRKFKAFLLVFLMITVLLAFNRLSGEQYTEMAKWVFGLFMAGNVGEHLKEAIKK